MMPSAFALAPGTKLDMSGLYTNGTLAVVAVPEPATWLSRAHADGRPVEAASGVIAAWRPRHQ